MTNSADTQGAYVRKVQEETQRYLQDLLTENERLRTLTASIDAEKRRAEERLATLEKELGSRREEQERLESQVAAIQDENRRFAQQYVEVEQQNSNLANLYVASYRLHGTLDRNEVLSVIQEILINLVGSEEVALFEVFEEESSLRLVSSFGIDTDRFGMLALDSGIIGWTARTGESFLPGITPPVTALPEEQRLTAAVPLKLTDRTIAVIAVFRLLEQKSGLCDLDREMFDLLATHAATALYCTTLHAIQNQTQIASK
jgi:hypothetical protein